MWVEDHNPISSGPTYIEEQFWRYCFGEWSVRLLRQKWAGYRGGARGRRLGGMFFGSSRNPILDLLRCSRLSRWGRWVGRGRRYQGRRSIFDHESLLGDGGGDMPQDSVSPSLLAFLGVSSCECQLLFSFFVPRGDYIMEKDASKPDHEAKLAHN